MAAILSGGGKLIDNVSAINFITDVICLLTDFFSMVIDYNTCF